MSTTKDGGPAFPVEFYDEKVGGDAVKLGMSLRDYFAGQALAGLVSSQMNRKDMNALSDGIIGGRRYGQVAYRLADAMLCARGEQESD